MVDGGDGGQRPVAASVARRRTNADTMSDQHHASTDGAGSAAGAAAMARTEPLETGERGVVVLTASIAGYEGQIGQIPYASSKAGVIGMALVAARDLASKLIRVCTIAPGIMDTPMLARLPDNVKQSLGASVPNPARLGRPEEYAALAMHIVENAYLNGETIRIDGALRMAPR